MSGLLEKYDFKSMNKDTLTKTRDMQLKSGVKSMASSFGELASNYINYNALKVENRLMKNQADAVELRAQEETNLLRQRFLGAAGSAVYGVASSGTKVSSGDLQDNLANSARDMGYDIDSHEESANRQARMIRGQAKMHKMAARAQWTSSLFDTASSFLNGGVNFANASQINQQLSSLNTGANK